MTDSDGEQEVEKIIILKFELKLVNNISAIGVDLGGTSISVGVVHNGEIIKHQTSMVPKEGTETEVIEALCKTINALLDTSIEGIGIGVPSLVDTEKGIVYDVQNIPSWKEKEIHIRDILQERFNLPVYVNNDANCFAIGEKFFGMGKAYKDIVALIVGTGLAAGIIIEDKLYQGYNCGAGEFGMIPYLDKTFEYYSCGQFFENVHDINGASAFELAKGGDKRALALFEELGGHLGHAITTILYTYDPEIIILGGSVSQAYSLFKDGMWNSIEKVAYKHIIDRLTIQVSDQSDIAVLGAAALYYNSRLAHSSTLKKVNEF